MGVKVLKLKLVIIIKKGELRMAKEMTAKAFMVKRNNYHSDNWKSIKWELVSHSDVNKLNARSDTVTISGKYPLSEAEITEAIKSAEIFTVTVTPQNDSRWRGYSFNLVSCYRNFDVSKLNQATPFFIKVFLRNCGFPQPALDSISDDVAYDIAIKLAKGEATTQDLTPLSNIGEILANNILSVDLNQAYSKAKEKYAVEQFRQELETPYNFTDSVIKKLMQLTEDEDGNLVPANPVKLSNEINKNIFNLIRIKGLGLNKLEELYLSVEGHTPYDVPMLRAKFMAALEEELDNRRANFVVLSDLRSKVLTTNFSIEGNAKISEALNQVIRELTTERKIVSVQMPNGKIRITTQQLFNMEKNIAQEIGLMATKKTTEQKELGYIEPGTMPAVSEEEIEEGISEAEKEQGFEFTAEQRNVIEQVINYPISSINGYAGTGKSSIMRAVDKIFVNKFGENSIAQCSFTGRAADSLSKSSQVPAKTAHAQMGIYSDDILNKLTDAYSKLDIDKSNDVVIEDTAYNALIGTKLFVIDEYPTLDLRIFALILRVADMLNARLILVGDSEQLPAIATSTDQAVNENDNIKHFNLSQVKRQGKDSRVYVDSLAVRQGTLPDDFKNAGSRANGDLKVFMGSSSLELRTAGNKAISLFLDKVQNGVNMNDIAIITPSNQLNTWLNQQIHRIFTNTYGSANSFEIGDVKKGTQVNVIQGEMIIDTHNFYARQGSLRDVNNQVVDLFNGNVGRVTKIYSNNNHKKMVADFGPMGEVVLEEGHPYLRWFELAYAITVHKAQGSTIPHTIAVIMAANNNAFSQRQLSRQLVYTAMTRASEELDIITTTNQFKQCLGNTVHKHKKSNLDVILGNQKGELVGIDKKETQSN